MSGTPWRRGAALALLLCAGALVASPRDATASITGALGDFVNRQAGLAVTNLRFPNIAGAFVEREALGSIQLPVPASSTSFTYSFNPDLGSFERLPGSLGPEFVDRATTVGQGRFALQLSYQFAGLTDLNGSNFGRQLEFAFLSRAEGGVAVGGAFAGRDFSLEQHIFTFAGTYGISPRLDLNLLVPVLSTTLDLDGVAGGFAGTGTAVRSTSFHDSAFGVGDIQLRTKYRFFDDPDRISLAAAVSLRLPSGRTQDLQGQGDVTVMPALIASRVFGRHDVHANLGVDVDATDGERTRARYAIGATLQPRVGFAFLLDVLGSSGLRDDRFVIPTGNVTPVCTPGQVRCVNYTASTTRVGGVVPRSDVVDLSTGFKFNPVASLNVSLLAIVPLTQQGLRAAVIPTGGLEWVF